MKCMFSDKFLDRHNSHSLPERLEIGSTSKLFWNHCHIALENWPKAFGWHFNGDFKEALMQTLNSKSQKHFDVNTELAMKAIESEAGTGLSAGNMRFVTEALAENFAQGLMRRSTSATSVCGERDAKSAWSSSSCWILMVLMLGSAILMWKQSTSLEAFEKQPLSWSSCAQTATNSNTGLLPFCDSLGASFSCLEIHANVGIH